MAIAKKTIDESLKPVSNKDMQQQAYEAQRMSDKIQEQFGDKRKPVIGLSDFQKAAASLPAREAEFKRRTEFVPQAYKTAQEAEERQTKAQDELANFYTDWSLKADELAMKQSQDKRASDLYSQEASANVDQKLKEIGFTAFKNDAQRQDSFEKAYLDGYAEKELLTGAINGQIKLADIDMYWRNIINDFDQQLMDVKAWADVDLKNFEQRMAADAKNWGAIVTGLTTLGKTGVDYMTTADANGLTGWDKVKDLMSTGSFTEDGKVANSSTTGLSPGEWFLNEPDSTFLEP